MSSKSHAAPPSTNAAMGFVRYFIGPLVLVTLLPGVILLVVYAMKELDGSIVALGSAMLDSGRRGAVLDRILSPPATLEELKVLAGFFLFQLAALNILPGPMFNGPTAPSGHTPSYRDNGLLHFAITLGAYYAVTRPLGLLEPGWVYDHIFEVMQILNLFGLAVSTVLYFKGLHYPSTKDSGTSGSFFLDFYWGTELYPRIAGVDLKQFLICRGGMVLWCLFAIGFLEKQVVLAGGWEHANRGQLVSVALAVIYIAKFFYWERWYLHAADIAVDRFGFMLVWGTLCFMPLIHTLQNFYLVTHRGLPLTDAQCNLIFVAGLICTFLNYDSDTQRHRVRSANGDCLVWGRKPVIIVADYVTADGKRRKNLLLCSGYNGLSRHFHYLPDIIQLVLYALPAGFERILPWTYAIYLTSLLVDRTWRIDDKCLAKYGQAYEQYMKLVPYRLIPYVW
ncbi:sterol delta-7-reductase [Hyaloraphidium curvatum]|nr:sterol delta-7-reductase [Hyaloraphidium curvatum]